MTLYLDASLLVAALTNEPETERMQAWLADQERGEFAISDWVVTEFSSALSIKLRAKRINAAHRADALAMFARLTAESFRVLPVTGVQFRTAAHCASSSVSHSREPICRSRPRMPGNRARGIRKVLLHPPLHKPPKDAISGSGIIGTGAIG